MRFSSIEGTPSLGLAANRKRENPVQAGGANAKFERSQDRHCERSEAISRPSRLNIEIASSPRFSQ
jgi:hypothetical protein